MTTAVAQSNALQRLDLPSAEQVMLVCAVALLSIGVVAISSASIDYATLNYDRPFFHLFRHGFYLMLALAGAAVVAFIPLSFWQRTGGLWLLMGFILLTLVLIPGIGREVNGSRRWLALGPLTLQCSEFVKVFVVIYLAGYLVRRQTEVRTQWKGFLLALAVVFVVTALLLAEPDFGATVVTVGTALGMLFLGGVRIGQFAAVVITCLLGAGVLAVSEEYRMARLTAFTDPWADQFNSGYQLVQSLIAFGRGEWFGVGLGNSVQKLLYLPEAHTDFVFAIWAEEFGVLGALSVIALFVGLVGAILRIARRAEQQGREFHAYVGYGVAFIISGQAFINMGVNTGLLPTKGLTLPLVSYGGSSLLACCGMLAMVWRIAHESQSEEQAHAKK